MLRIFPRNVWAVVLWVRKNPRKIPSKFPTKFSKFPCKKSKKIHRRASAGAQGEELIHRRDWLQLQFRILAELINNYSAEYSRIGPFST